MTTRKRIAFDSDQPLKCGWCGTTIPALAAKAIYGEQGEGSEQYLKAYHLGCDQARVEGRAQKLERFSL